MTCAILIIVLQRYLTWKKETTTISFLFSRQDETEITTRATNGQDETDGAHLCYRKGDGGNHPWQEHAVRAKANNPTDESSQPVQPAWARQLFLGHNLDICLLLIALVRQLNFLIALLPTR